MAGDGRGTVEERGAGEPGGVLDGVDRPAAVAGFEVVPVARVRSGQLDDAGAVSARGIAADVGEPPLIADAPAVRRAFVADQMIIKVPVRPLPPSEFEWVERKGPKCLPASVIRGALLTGRDHVDFMLPQKQRIRATFDDDCPALDFYGVFYLNTNDDKVCAGRDMVRSRVGSGCVIEKFRRLSPQRRH